MTDWFDNSPHFWSSKKKITVIGNSTNSFRPWIVYAPVSKVTVHNVKFKKEWKYGQQNLEKINWRIGEDKFEKRCHTLIVLLICGRQKIKSSILE